MEAENCSHGHLRGVSPRGYFADNVNAEILSPTVPDRAASGWGRSNALMANASVALRHELPAGDRVRPESLGRQGETGLHGAESFSSEGRPLPYGRATERKVFFPPRSRLPVRRTPYPSGRQGQIVRGSWQRITMEIPAGLSFWRRFPHPEALIRGFAASGQPRNPEEAESLNQQSGSCRRSDENPWNRPARWVMLTASRPQPGTVCQATAQCRGRKGRFRLVAAARLSPKG